MEYPNGFITECLFRYIGQTVTIFTKSGGISGGGFTGVLLSIDNTCLRLLTCEGQAPCCPVGSSCTGVGYGSTDNFIGNPLGAICIIPMCAVVCFTHNAI